MAELYGTIRLLRIVAHLARMDGVRRRRPEIVAVRTGPRR
jgi:hypothetical protein